VTPQLIYLHGFASSPGSTKASFFRFRLLDLGLTIEVPELAPDFRRMTITSQLGIVEPLLERGPAILLGSSLGGYLATLVAERHPDLVSGLVLFAPAFGFVTRWQRRLGPAAMQRWREHGTLDVYHYGKEREEPLSIDLIDDAAAHPEQPEPSCPCLIFAGRRDEAVPLEAIQRFADARPGRDLVVLDAGHEMSEVLEPIWQLTHGFLSSLGAAPAPERKGF
jgi:pimeloyl-ACP methyl ester carboxylesterase